LDMVRIAVFTHGRVDAVRSERIREILEECYNRLPNDLMLVELHLFSTKSLLTAFLSRERSDLGVSSSEMGEGFFAMHDAWRGVPRILVSLDRLLELPALVQVGGLRHEAAHSILHGSPEYYIFPMPPSLAELGRRFSLSLEVLTDLLYLLSIAVKDYEATRLLYGGGYVEDQAEYVQYLLEPSGEEVAAWSLSRGRAVAELLYLASQFKVLACASPLLEDNSLKGVIFERMRGAVAHLPDAYAEPLLELSVDGLKNLGDDTLENVNYVSELFCGRVAKPLMEARHGG